MVNDELLRKQTSAEYMINVSDGRKPDENGNRKTTDKTDTSCLGEYNRKTIGVALLFILFAAATWTAIFGGRNFVVNQNRIYRLQRELQENLTKFQRFLTENDADIKKQLLNQNRTIEILGNKLDDKARIYRKLLETRSLDCEDLRQVGMIRSGVYRINNMGRQIRVFCDMRTDGGGWTIIQRRIDGRVDFNQKFSEYQVGFGKINGEHWLGLQTIYLLTNNRNYTLRIDIEDFEENEAYATYSTFIVGDISSNYQLTVNGYHGNAGDSLKFQNKEAFSSFDRDNDGWQGNCAAHFQGGWWFKRCHFSNLNGKYIGKGGTSTGKGITWYHWKKNFNSLKRVEMKLRPN